MMNEKFPYDLLPAKAERWDTPAPYEPLDF